MDLKASTLLFLSLYLLDPSNLSSIQTITSSLSSKLYISMTLDFQNKRLKVI